MIETLDPPLRRLAHILAETPGVPVKREALIRRMWPGIDDYPAAHARHHLHELVHRLRAAYMDEQGAYVIATAPRLGYVWLGGRLVAWMAIAWPG